MRELTRTEVIKKLVDDDIDTIVNKYAITYVGDILREGFKGYNNYTKEELYQEHIGRFNEGVKIK